MIDDRKLIAEIKNHPLLYDPGVPENRDVNAKESTWDFIAKSLGYTVRECKMRWKSLRERFARERKKIIMNNNGENIGSDDDPDKDGQNKGTWHLMKDMYFLWNFVFHRNMNRSKSLLYLNSTQDDHSNLQIPTNSLSAPIWLLPSITHGALPQNIQPQPINRDDTSSECGETSTNRVKDPLSNDEDNSLCFDIGSSDSEDETPARKRQIAESTPKPRIDSTGIKRIRRNSNEYPASMVAKNVPVTTNIIRPHQNDTLASSSIQGGASVVIMNESERNQMHSNSPSDGSRFNRNPAEINNIDQDVKGKASHIISGSIKELCECGCKKQTEEELFCSSIAASMQRLTAKQRALLKLQIQKVLYEIEYPE